jgi:hypothetical protein
MIKVVFRYTTKTKDLPELMAKFGQSADSKFASEVTNTKIELFQREEDGITIISLEIYYNNVDEYNQRTAFERTQKEWQEIWFNPDNKHTLESVEIFNCM